MLTANEPKNKEWTKKQAVAKERYFRQKFLDENYLFGNPYFER